MAYTSRALSLIIYIKRSVLSLFIFKLYKFFSLPECA